MTRLLVRALFALCFIPSVSSAVDIKNIRSCYTPFGATRQNTKYLPGDNIFMTFDVEGLTIDPKSGKANYDTTLEFLDAKGESLFKNSTPNEVRPQLGGTRMPGLIEFNPGVKRAPGRYSLRMTVHDKLGKDAKAFTYPFDVIPETFGFVGISAPPIGFCGQIANTGFALVHLTLDAKKQPNTEVVIRILDEASKPVGPPVQILLPRDMPDSVDLEKANFVPLSYPVYLNRVGRFTVEVQATDKISKKTASFTYPMTVLDINSFTGK